MEAGCTGQCGIPTPGLSWCSLLDLASAPLSAPALPCPRFRARETTARARPSQPQSASASASPRLGPFPSLLDIFCVAAVYCPSPPPAYLLTHHSLLSCHPYPPRRRVEITLRSSPNHNPCRRSTLPAFYPSPFPSRVRRRLLSTLLWNPRPE